ncbi:hypothetical protein AAE478_003271 [Parahypoxylon ruwenzoriense]
MAIKTRFLIISDTHGGVFDVKEVQQADVVIHCGDLTEESKIDEFRTTINLLRRLPAPLKLPDLVEKNFGGLGEPRRLFNEAKDAGITFLDEGNYQFTLQNGAVLRVYASPFTPSEGGWAFQYPPGDKHDFAVADNVDVAITHGPPHGVMDYTDSKQRAGCPYLFEAIRRAKPLLHCFGHIHEGWDSKLVTWRDNVSEKPSHFADIDNSRSVTIEKLSNLIGNKQDDIETITAKEQKVKACIRRGFCSTSHCSDDIHPLNPGSQTLFVNASIEGKSDDLISQPPWIVDLELPAAAD